MGVRSTRRCLSAISRGARPTQVCQPARPPCWPSPPLTRLHFRCPDLEQLFSTVGKVVSVRGVLFKRPPYRPRGIAFVVMATPADAASAVEQLNNTPVGGRELMVQMAEPLPPTFGRNYTSRGVGACSCLSCHSCLASTKPSCWATHVQLQARRPGEQKRSASAAWPRRPGGCAAQAGSWGQQR
jgi:hypothetical protein